MTKQFTKDDIYIDNGYVIVLGIGTVGLWWSSFDKKVCISYGFGESFYAKDYDEVKNGILKILNK